MNNFLFAIFIGSQILMVSAAEEEEDSRVCVKLRIVLTHILLSGLPIHLLNLTANSFCSFLVFFLINFCVD